MSGEYIETHDLAADSTQAMNAALDEVARQCGVDPDTIGPVALVFMTDDGQMGFGGNLINDSPKLRKFLLFAALSMLEAERSQAIADMVPDDLSGLGDIAA